MQRFHHLGGMAAIALTALGLSACYPPPPATVATVPPGEATALPPQPPAQPYVPSDVVTALPPQPGALCAADGRNNPALLADRCGAAIRADNVAGSRPEQRRDDFRQCRAVRSPAVARGDPAPSPPSPLALWQPGHWSWSGGQYVWIAGRRRTAAYANRKLDPWLLAARAERLGLDRRPLGVRKRAQPSSGCALRRHMTALGGVRPASVASLKQRYRFWC